MGIRDIKWGKVFWTKRITHFRERNLDNYTEITSWDHSIKGEYWEIKLYKLRIKSWNM